MSKLASSFGTVHRDRVRLKLSYTYSSVAREEVVIGSCSLRLSSRGASKLCDKALRSLETNSSHQAPKTEQDGIPEVVRLLKDGRKQAAHGELWMVVVAFYFASLVVMLRLESLSKEASQAY